MPVIESVTDKNQVNATGSFKIEEIDLSKIRSRLIHKLKWAEERADVAVAEYKKFLQLMFVHPNVIFAPSSEVDEVWHAHILHTALYAKQCEYLFGRFIHHNPTDPEESVEKKENTSYLNTLKYYKEVFGEEAHPKIWPQLKKSKVIGCDTADCCGGMNKAAGCDTSDCCGGMNSAVNEVAGCGGCGNGCSSLVESGAAGCGGCGSGCSVTV